MTNPNANLTDEQKQVNRMHWLLNNAAAKAQIPTTVGVIDAMAHAMVEIMRENHAVVVWLSEFERDAAGDDPA